MQQEIIAMVTGVLASGWQIEVWDGEGQILPASFKKDEILEAIEQAEFQIAECTVVTMRGTFIGKFTTNSNEDWLAAPKSNPAIMECTENLEPLWKPAQ